jgi:hypothetical protein
VVKKSRIAGNGSGGSHDPPKARPGVVALHPPARSVPARRRWSTPLKPNLHVQILSRWTILRDATENDIPSFVPLAPGCRLVVAAENVDGESGERSASEFALAWTNRHGEEVVTRACVYRNGGMLLSYKQDEATWLPEGWELNDFPAGWSLAHLDAWLDFAECMVKDSDFRDVEPRWLPYPRNLVAHAHMIVRHLKLEGCWQEPRAGIDRDGCLAELRELREFFRRVLSKRNGNDNALREALAKRYPKWRNLERDLNFLRLKEEGLTPAKIRDNCRKEHPEWKLAAGTKGAEVVESALKKTKAKIEKSGLSA